LLNFIKDGILTLPKTTIQVHTKVEKKDLKEVRVIPQGSKYFKIEVIYSKEMQDLNLDKENVVGIDVGVNNLMAITSNQASSFSCLINGKPLKSINQFYNKRSSELKSTLKIINNLDWSKSLWSLNFRRKNKVDDYLHKASRKLIQLCTEFNIGRIVVGHNKLWKQEVNLGSNTNQNFVQIPFNRLIQMISYKAEEVGIQVDLVEESYTSKIDHLANESMENHEVYLGKRTKRGLFKSSTGLKLNADINGALGMLRKAKVACESFFQEIVASRGSVLRPVKLSC